MSPEATRHLRERALLSSGRALTILERGAEGAAVLAATDQAHAAIAELNEADDDRPPLADLLHQLLVEIDRARLRRLVGSTRLDAALRRVRTAWFATLHRDRPSSPGPPRERPPDTVRRPRT